MSSHKNVRERQAVTIKKQQYRDRVHLQFVRDKESFRQMKMEWNKLVMEADCPVYLTFEWLFCWWTFFGRHPKRELFIGTVRVNRRLVGIFPFYKGRSSVGPVVFQRRLSLMGAGTSGNEVLGFADNYGYSDFLDVIAHPDYREAVRDCLVKLLRSDTLNIDLVSLPHVREDSFVMRELVPGLEESDIPINLRQTDECPYIELPESIKSYKAQLGSSSRRRRFRKNLESVGTAYSVEEPITWEKVDEGLTSLYKLHQDRWNRLGYPGTFVNERFFGFLKQMSREAFENGWLWFKLGKNGERVFVARLALNYGRRFYDWLSGFDVSSPYAKHSPGLGLLSLMIDEAIKVNSNRVELLRGAERYKFDFTERSKYNWHLSLPLYRNATFFRSLSSRLLEKAAEAYSQLCREWTLLQVHYQESGLLRMWYSYASFRLGRLSEKMNASGLFTESKN